MRSLTTKRHRAGAVTAATLLIVGALAAMTASTTPPHAAASTVSDSVLVYDGTFTSDERSIDGETMPQRVDDVRVELQCSGGTCEITSFRPEFESVPTVTPQGSSTTISWNSPASGNPCPNLGENYVNAISGTMTITADSIVGSGVKEPSEWFDCGGTSRSMMWGSDWRFDVTLTLGDPCVIDASRCTASSPGAEDVTDSTGSTPGQAENGPTDAPTGFWARASVPSTLSALPTPDDTLAAPQLVTAAVLTLVLVILMALPTALLNSASARATQRLSAWRERWAQRRGGLVGAIPEALGTLGRRLAAAWRRASTAGRGLPLASATLLAASVISGFIDPDFGIEPATPRIMLSMALGFALDVLLGWIALLILLPRLVPGASARVEAKPATLLVVLGAVIVTRLTHFEPGIVFGLVAGIVVGGTLAAATRVRVSLVTLGWGYGLAIVAWIAYTAMGPLVEQTTAASADGVPPLGLVLLVETLAATTIAGIAALPVALVPLRGLTGHRLWQWSPWRWAALYSVGLLSFFLVLMPMPFAWGEVHVSLAAWVSGYLLYAVVAVTVWLSVVQPWRRDDTGAPAPTKETTTR